MLARPLKDEANIILNYIRKNTESKNEWVLIGSRDMPRLFNISQIYFTKLIEPIKEHAHIIYEVDESFASRFKPYRFRWVEDTQEKIDHGLTEKQFYWLDKQEVQYIKNTVAIDQFAKLSKLLKTCNLLAGDGAKDWWISIKISDLADLTVSTVKETERRLTLLISKNLLVKAKHSNYYRLALNPEHLSEIIYESKQDVVRIKPRQERKKRKPELHIVKEISYPGMVLENNSKIQPKVLDKLPQNDVESIHEEQAERIFISREMSSEQTLNNTGVGVIINNAQSARQSAISAANNMQLLINQLSELQKQEDANRRSYEAFLKLDSEYNNVRSENDSLKEKLHTCETKVQQFEHEIKLLCEYNEAFLVNAQSRMDVLLGVISGYLDEYVVRPKYEKTDELINARLKKNIWAAVDGVSKEIVDFKPECKFPPNLR